MRLFSIVCQIHDCPLPPPPTQDYVRQHVHFATQNALQQLDCKHIAKLCSLRTLAGLVTA